MSRRELFGSLCTMVFLVNLSRIIFAPLLQPAATDPAIAVDGAEQLGIVTSAAWLGSAAPRLPTGYLLTRVSRHRVIASTGGLLVVTALFTGQASSVLHLVVGAFLMGLSSGVYFIAANPLVSELFPDRVGSAIGIHGTSSQVAAAGAPLVLSGILLVESWRTTFLCIGLLGAGATGLLLWAAHRTELPEAGVHDRSLLTAGREQWQIILTGIAIIGAAGFLWNAVFNLYGDYLTAQKALPAETGRVLLSVMFAAGIPAFFVSGRLADAVPNVPLLIGIISTFAILVAGLTFASSVAVITGISLLLGYTIHSLFPTLDTYLLSSLPDRHRASAYAIYSSSMMFVQALGSGTVGTAVSRDLIGYNTAFRLLAAVVCGVAFGLFVLYRTGRLPDGTPGSR